MIYWAQSTSDLMLQIKLHEKMDTPECKQSFEREVLILEDRVRVRAVCYEGEDSIRIFDTEEVMLKKLVVPANSTWEWKGDGRVQLTLRKENGPSFWKYLL